MFHVEHRTVFEGVGYQTRFEESQETLATKPRDFFGENLPVACAQFGGHIVDQQNGAHLSTGI